MPKKVKKQAYIPGLTARPDDIEMPPRAPDPTFDDILVRDFTKGKKNPTMCLHEYCQRNHIDLQYKDGPVEQRRGTENLYGCYGCRVIIDDLQYPQGVGNTKKEAKNEASRLCFRILVGLDATEPEPIAAPIDDNRFAEVRNLLDVCAEKNLIYDKMMTRDNEDQHVCTVILTNLSPVKHRSADRDEAVIQAHKEALKLLGAHHLLPPEPEEESAQAAASDPPRVPNPFQAQKREAAAYEMLHMILQTIPQEFAGGDQHIAAIFRAVGFDDDESRVGDIVAFGSGSSSISVESMSLDGRCVLDSSCLTTARRAFKRYLSQEMLYCYDGRASIFERNPDDNTRLKLRPGVYFDLYVSHPLEGDYKEFLETPSQLTEEQLKDIEYGAHVPTFLDDQHGALRCRNELGMVELTSQTPDQKTLAQVKLSNEMWVMSESDKLLRWNIIGIQGAVFTHFIDPIYLTSVTVGFNPMNDHGHLSRAVCCRVYPEMEQQLPAPYRINHPALSFSPTDTRSLAIQNVNNEKSLYSLNRGVYDDHAELCVGQRGRSNEASPFQVSKQFASRQCKAGFHLKWFGDLCKRIGDRKSQFNGKSPAEVKDMASSYQTAKQVFLDHCFENNIGKWIRAPPELDMFQK